jgi:hypothetical protein
VKRREPLARLLRRIKPEGALRLSEEVEGPADVNTGLSPPKPEWRSPAGATTTMSPHGGRELITALATPQSIGPLRPAATTGPPESPTHTRAAANSNKSSHQRRNVGSGLGTIAVSSNGLR